MNFLRVKMIYNTVCKIFYSILNRKKCVQLCMFDLFHSLCLCDKAMDPQNVCVCVYVLCMYQTLTSRHHVCNYLLPNSISNTIFRCTDYHLHTKLYMHTANGPLLLGIWKTTFLRSSYRHFTFNKAITLEVPNFSIIYCHTSLQV